VDAIKSETKTKPGGGTTLPAISPPALTVNVNSSKPNTGAPAVGKESESVALLPGTVTATVAATGLTTAAAPVVSQNV